MITGTRYHLTQEINRQSKLAADIERALTEISTGKRIQTPSDDPTGSARVSEIARFQSDQATWKRNLESAASLSALADSALGGTVSAVTRVKELMVSAATGTLSAADRSTIALELRSIADEIAATQTSRDSRGDPIFPPGDVLEIPVGRDLRIRAVGTRDSVFTIGTAGGPKDLAALVRDAADAIELTDPAARAAATDVALAEAEAAVIGITRARGEQGSRGNRIDNLIERLEQSDLVAEEERTALESTDIVEVVARLQSRQLTLQAAQAAFARINASTLFDLLR